MKTAIITGASTGMGREFAKEIHRRYIHIEEVWVIARNKEKLEDLKEELGQKGVFVLPLDLTCEEDLKRYQETLEKKKPDVCILVNSAGYGKIGTVEEVGLEDNRGMVRLNCQSLTEVTCMTLPYMRKGGQIINLASSASFLPQPEFAVYAATKAYVLSFSRGLRCEIAKKGIHVTAVCPGPVDTEFMDVAQAEGTRKLKQMKMLIMVKPNKVVKKAIKDARKGKEKSVYGIVVQLFEVICKVIPHRLILKFLG